MIPYWFALKACDFQNTLDYSSWPFLWSHPKSGAPLSFKSHGLVPLVCTCRCLPTWHPRCHCEKYNESSNRSPNMRSPHGKYKYLSTVLYTCRRITMVLSWSVCTSTYTSFPYHSGPFLFLHP